MLQGQMCWDLQEFCVYFKTSASSGEQKYCCWGFMQAARDRVIDHKSYSDCS